MRIRLVFGSAAVASGVLAAAFASAQLPPLPGAGGPQGTSTIPPPGVDMPPPVDAAATLERAKRGVVVLEQGGRAVGLGTVLGTDPRILTALSAMGTSDACDVRYADGHVVHARIGHKDAALDLALLIPLSGRYSDGLPASGVDPSTVEVKSFGAGPQNRPSAQASKVKGRVDARAKDGSGLPGLLDLDAKTALLPGAPLIDPTGSVVGVAVHVCRVVDASACTVMTAGEPIGTIRGFLVKTPVNAVPPSPWLGIQGAPDASGAQRGVRVLATAPGSPAQTGGLKAQDLIVAVDAQPVETPEKLQELIAKHAVGETVKLQVTSSDKAHDVTITLRAAP